MTFVGQRSREEPGYQTIVLADTYSRRAYVARTAAAPSCRDRRQDLPAQTAWLESVGGDSKCATAVTVYDLLDRRGAEHDEPAELDEVARAAAARFEVRAEIARDTQTRWAGRKRRKEVMQLALADVSLLLREKFARWLRSSRASQVGGSARESNPPSRRSREAPSVLKLIADDRLQGYVAVRIHRLSTAATVFQACTYLPR